MNSLCKDQPLVARCLALLASPTVLDGATCVPCRMCAPLSLALHVLVHSCHPAVHLVDQSTLAALIHVLSPSIDGLLCWLNACVVVVFAVLQ